MANTDDPGMDVPPAVPMVAPLPPARPAILDLPTRPTIGQNHIRLPMPTMSEANIDGYFLSLDFWFQASNITDDQQKYYIVMSQIPPHRLIELGNLIEEVPPAAKYAYIKNSLLNQFTDSQQRRLKRVLSEMPLGDQKPSLLYNTMARVAEGALSESALIDLWGSRLPENIHMAVAASEGTIASRLKLADAIFNSLDLRAHAAINEVKASYPATNNDQNQPGSCHPEILELVQMIGAIVRDNQNFLKQNGPKTSARRQLQFDYAKPRETKRRLVRPPPPVEEEDWDTPIQPHPTPASVRRRDVSIERFDRCWYHRTFGKEATTCRAPCTFQK